MASHQPEASTSLVPEEHLPRDARLMALLLASKGVEDTTPQVLHQLLEFAHRYTTDILLDALTYNEHSGKAGKIDLSDVELAVQAKVNWEFKESGERDYLHPIAQKLNSLPLPPVPETAFIRLPHPKHMLTAPNFNLLPNKPPPAYGPEGDSSDDDDGSDDDDEDESEQGRSLSFGTPQAASSSLPPPPSRADANGSAAADEDEAMSDEDEDDEDDMMQVVDIPTLPSANLSGVGEKRPAEDDDDDDYDA